MSGHSKWANIRHRKSAQDAKRGKIFTRLIREITVAAQAGTNPADNPVLRNAIDKALAGNMSKAQINRAIDRVGSSTSDQLQEIRFEGYAAAGVAVLLDTMTDNRNRTVAEVRHVFNKYGGNLGTDGSVAWLFERRGELFFEPGTDEELLMDAAIAAGAEDVFTDDDGSIRIITMPESLSAVVQSCRDISIPPDDFELINTATTTVPVDAAQAEKVRSLLAALEDMEDTRGLYCNADFIDDQ